jgi:hypothetical protein
VTLNRNSKTEKMDVKLTVHDTKGTGKRTQNSV